MTRIPAWARNIVPSPLNIKEILDGCTAEPWLLEATTKGASLPSSWARAVSAGLIVRFWRPSREEWQGTSTPWLVDWPFRRALRWFKELPVEEREFLHFSLIRTGSSLCELAEIAAQASDSGDPEAKGLVHYLLQQRDDAHSVWELLPKEYRSPVAAETLGMLDRLATTKLSSLSRYTFPGDSRLIAAARKSGLPDAIYPWWANIACPW